MADGCIEKLDWAFIKWILWEGRSKETREKRKALAQRYADKVTVIKNQRQLDRYYSRKGI